MLSIVCAEDEQQQYQCLGSMQPQEVNLFLFWVKERNYFFWRTIAASVIINRIKGIEIHDEPMRGIYM